MKAEHLRIGNFVSITYETKKDVADTCPLDYLSELARDHFVISHFSTYEINVFIGKEIVEFSLSEIEPIPLTAEWLEKFGFGFTGYTYDKGKLSINYKPTTPASCRTYYNSWAISEKRPEYVHQLQNLYFALTGEELTIKS